jgi:hypothetical protein
VILAQTMPVIFYIKNPFPTFSQQCRMQLFPAMTVQKFAIIFCRYLRPGRFVPKANHAKIGCIAKGKHGRLF